MMKGWNSTKDKAEYAHGYSHSSINPDFLKLRCGFAQAFSGSRLFIYLCFSILLVLSFDATPMLEELTFTTSSERVIAVLSYT